MRFTHDDLRALNARFEQAGPTEIFAFVRDTFGPRAALLSSMQRTDTALGHVADRAGCHLDVLFVDTGVLHNETLATRDLFAERHPKMKLRTLAPARTFAEQTRDEGVLYLTGEGQLRCCDLRKSAPLHTVKDDYDALVSALRRSEGGARASVQPFGLDPEMNALRVHPMHAWTRAELDAYIEKYRAEIPVNPLHGWGFPTIGCWPCTTPVREDEQDRAGRWRHLAGVEYCGINPVDRAGGSVGIELDDRYEAALRA